MTFDIICKLAVSVAIFVLVLSVQLVLAVWLYALIEIRANRKKSERKRGANDET